MPKEQLEIEGTQGRLNLDKFINEENAVGNVGYSREQSEGQLNKWGGWRSGGPLAPVEE